jgi:hypothetical protein
MIGPGDGSYFLLTATGDVSENRAYVGEPFLVRFRG